MDYLDVLRERSYADRLERLKNEFHWLEFFFGASIGAAVITVICLI